MPPFDPNSSPPRKHCKRYNTPGHSHYLTFSCFRRQQFLSKDHTRQWLAEALATAREKHAFHLIAYVFMPEHVHLLIHPKLPRYDISKILQAIKLPVARKARTFVLNEAPEFILRMQANEDGSLSLRFWQAGGGHDRNIYSPEELWEKINYIHNNPVKRGLVTRAADWQWSSAANYAKIRTGPLPIDNKDLPWLQ